MIECKDSIEFLKSKAEYEFDISFSDVPYALGSEVIIGKDGKPEYKKARDFLNKWDMPNGKYWEEWFKETYRTLKHGGYCIVYGMDRQLLMFKYYACLAGFLERQSLYWLYLSNFPKSTEMGKSIDKHFKADREVTHVRELPDMRNNKLMRASVDNDSQKLQHNYTAPSTDLAKKYDGYRTSMAPLKQTHETIMIFQKPYKTKSCLHDTIARENGDKTCTSGAINIPGTRIPSSTDSPELRIHTPDMPTRYPSQMFFDEEAEEFLNSELECKSSDMGYKCIKYDTELYIYNKKVGKVERHLGLQEGTNVHPTVKPIDLNYKILKLFKLPIEQKIIYPFAGVGSEVIGGIQAGFNQYEACEINQEYVDIGNARIAYWAAELIVE